MAENLERKAQKAAISTERHVREIGNLLRDLNTTVSHIVRHRGKYYMLPAGEDDYKY
jgi:hypothetical protein